MSQVQPGNAAAEAALDRGSGLAFAALRHGSYRSYFVGNMLSMMADDIEHVISYWVLWQAFHSPILSGFAVIAHWTPHLLLAVYFGMLADRFDCRRIIQASQVCFISASVLWGVLILTGSLQIWHAVVLLILHGLAGALWSPAGQLVIHDIVGREHLQSAVRLNATSRQLGFLVGPAVGGGLMLLLDPAYGLLVNALLYLPVVAWTLRVPYTGHLREDASGVRRPSVSPREAVRVLRDLSGNRTILAMVALGGFSSLLVGTAFQAQMPEFADKLGTDRSGVMYSILMAGDAAGAVVGGLLLESAGLLRARARTAILCGTLFSLSMIGFALAGSYMLGFVMLFLAGLFNLAFVAMAQTLVQLLAPSHLRGRAIGLFNMANAGLKVGSGLTVGVLGAYIGSNWSLGLSAAVLLVITLGLLPLTPASQRRPTLGAA